MSLTKSPCNKRELDYTITPPEVKTLVGLADEGRGRGRPHTQPLRLNLRPTGGASQHATLRHVLILPALLLLSLVSLSPGPSRSVTCDSSHQQQSNRLSRQVVMTQDGPDSEPRFHEEPQDTMALLGTSVLLPCSFENLNTNDYRVFWERGQMHVRLLASHQTAKQEAFKRYSLPPTDSQAQISNPAIANFSLRIDPVELVDDEPFFCHAVARRGESMERSARLTVLQPPTQLSIRAKAEEPAADSSSGGDNDVVTLHHHHNHLVRGSSADSLQLDDRAALERRLYADNSDAISAASGAADATQPIAAPWASNSSADNQSEIGADELSSSSPSNGSDVTLLIVKQNTRLRLECSANRAKPHAELVWLDHRQQQVAKRHETGGDTNNGSYVEETIRADPAKVGLALAALAWSFEVQRHHQNQVLTCLARHPAFEQAQLFPRLYGRELRRRVRLEVHYKPEILGLTKEPAQAHENQSITFQCNAQGRPNQLAYSWFIDRKLVANATRPELRIERLTRQMHLREIRCQVSNSVGSSTIEHRLLVRYAPAFVTHLLPESLQPPPAQDQSLDSRLLASRLAAPKTSSGDQLTKPPATSQLVIGPSELRVGRQLTRGYLIGQEVQLRCDFDANPRVTQVQWFKVANEKYSIMGNVTPAEADELIGLGEARAQFVQQQQQQQHGSLADTSDEEGPKNLERRRRRQARDSPEVVEQMLDYELMSESLLEELASYGLLDQQQQQPANASSGSQTVEGIPSQPPTQTTAPIDEPLQWIVTRPGASADAHRLAASGAPPGVALEPIGEEPDSMVLVSVNDLVLMGESPTTSQFRVPFLRREAQVASSFINLNRSNYESAGKYICLARSQDGTRSVARSIYLVLMDRPRIISSPSQWAPFGASRLQVECLAQTRGVVDNMTSFSWFKDGKPIVLRKDPQAASGGKSPHGAANERSYTMEVRRSPDLLYMRSTLYVEGAEYHDFGRYSCLVVNSFGNDSMPINLQPSAPTGLVFAVMASLAIGSVLLVVCILGLVMICAPQRKLEAKLSQLQQQHHRGADIGKSSSGSASDSRSDSCNGGARAKEQELCDNELINGATTAANGKQPFAAVASQAAINSMMILHPHQHGVNQLNCQQQDHQFNGSTNEDSSRQPPKRPPPHQRSSSLKQPFGGGQPHPHHHHQQQQQRNTKFAAIHESLEHKLHLGQPLFGHHLRQPSLDSTGRQQHTPVDERSQSSASSSGEKPSQTEQVDKTEAVSELEEGSLLNRLWARLLMRPDKLAGSRRIKSRPVISMPVSVAANQQRQSNIRRSSLSTSLSVLGTDSGDSAENAKTSGANNKSLNLKRVNATNLVSSSANLIQDSTTASDGSVGSSGRSSSNSSGEQAANRANDERQLAAAGGDMHVAYATTGAPGEAHYMAQPVLDNSTNWPNQVNGGMQMSDCSMYVNEHLGATNHLPYSQFAPGEHNNIYSNGHHMTTTYHAQDPSFPMTSIGYTAGQPLGWSDHSSQSAPMGHYQHPALPAASESYFSPAAQQPFYATICNNNKQAPLYGHISSNNSMNTASMANNNNYIALPHRPASTQCPPQRVIPTSDSGDAFFDQNYGTMLSRSKAYTKLGYATSSALTATHYIAAHSVSSASSSPSSSTHTNPVQPNLNLDTIAQQLQAVTSGATMQVQSDGSTVPATTITTTTTTNNNNTTTTVDDNGLATHV